jgi:hypothetical protein
VLSGDQSRSVTLAVCPVSMARSWPVALHRRTGMSPEAVARVCPSGAQARSSRAAVCPRSVPRGCPSAPQSRATSLFKAHVARVPPTGDHRTRYTGPVSVGSVTIGSPAGSHSRTAKSCADVARAVPSADHRAVKTRPVCPERMAASCPCHGPRARRVAPGLVPLDPGVAVPVAATMVAPVVRGWPGRV